MLQIVFYKLSRKKKNIYYYIYLYGVLQQDLREEVKTGIFMLVLVNLPSLFK